MIFRKTDIPGAYLICPDNFVDDQGTFGRTFCAEEFRARGIHFDTVQCNTSLSWRRGTLCGLHYLAAPKQEPKLVRCIRGAVFDVILDLRRESRTYRRWLGIGLDGQEPRSLFIPPGCAHGYLTLSDDAELFYQMGAPYDPALVRGVRWNDPAFGISWPFTPTMITPRDAEWPDYRE